MTFFAISLADGIGPAAAAISPTLSTRPRKIDGQSTAHALRPAVLTAITSLSPASRP